MNQLYLIFLSIIGFAVSAYLYYSKTNDKKLYCFIGQHCDDVVKSKYGETFGVENTLVGLIYYGLVFAYGAFLNRNIFIGNIIYYFIVIASIASVLFSLYLTGVQAFVLKKWCEYCIVSSTVSILIMFVLIL